MEKILVIYGGKSVEHDISIITALQAMNAIKNDYEILPIYVSHEGEFFTGDNLQDVNIYADFHALVKNKKSVYLEMGKGQVLIKQPFKLKHFAPTAALVCMHGLNGEDGAIAGALQLASIPYTCPSIEASAVCMDKAAAKAILNECGIPNCPYVSGEAINVSEAIEKLSFPVIVKPSRCGSSVGIEKCTNVHQLKRAMEIAKYYDKKLILEHFIENGREFNCAALNNGGNVSLSKVCEVKSKGLYSFDEKYLKDKPLSSYDVEKEVEIKVKEMTAETVKVLECEGVTRVDFLMDAEGQLFVNEVNTIPGSLAFYLFSSMREIVVEMIEEAKSRFAKKESFSFSFDSGALSIFANANMDKYSKK